MATTIEEVQRIDEIKCTNTGAVEVLKGNYYIKTSTKMIPVLDGEGNDTGETEEQVTVTEDRISNWRVSITAHDTSLSDSVLGDSADVAKAHWTKFPIPEPVEVDSAVDGVPGLIQALQDQDAKVRANAAMVLGEIGTPEAIKAVEGELSVLIQALQNQDEIVRADSARALGSIKESAKDAVPTLIQLLQDEGKNVRASAARALVQIGTPEAIKAIEDEVSDLIQALQNQDGIVRADSAYVLGAIGESAKDAVPALIQVLQDQDMDVRINAVEALEKIGTPEALKAVEGLDKNNL